MRAVEVVFEVVWAALWVYWLVAALSRKKGRGGSWRRSLGVRLALVVVVIVLVNSGAFRGSRVHMNPWLAGDGLVLLVLGLGVCVWARVHLGRNWGSPMTQKYDPELVTSGPYRSVRHPIYSGILVAVVGTAVALNWTILIVAALAAVFFVYSATVEERYMSEQFPDSYPQYKRSSKMLVPFLF
jgi:protein-S-isoprenylcysteine O-methyltransferase Ste14